MISFVVDEKRSSQAFSDMRIASLNKALALPPIFHPIGNRLCTFGAGLLQVLRNPSELRCAGTTALLLFVASLALALALTHDRHKLASEINAKTLNAAAAIQALARLPLRVQN